ncbi:hxlR-like helix-turn-helix family protein [Ochrobactrum quorumnocens]|uniref:HxlR-like helix-turn-helix family protein n=1 Tax=Ochrobactrum quorumnocens TaxID=271865 RepID=A0A248UBC8_9HYPH|nr:helix-turn-helix domain-containing protein [[Ochrobactrum] quorumnocens]ASV84035.1 hxlR-like helix-turn-helix family protein [[Ochrobactrum] quorumnocens]
MKPGDFKETSACKAVTDILSRVGDKWSVLIVSYLGNRPMRFNEIRRTVDGISQKMLTTTLRNLERDGFVSRTMFPTIPPKVEYELTELGQDLLKPVRALGEWAIANEVQVMMARARYDARLSGDDVAHADAAE